MAACTIERPVFVTNERIHQTDDDVRARAYADVWQKLNPRGVERPPWLRP